MMELLLILGLAGIVSLGFIVMRRIDEFCDANGMELKKEREKKGASCVMLTNKTTDEDIMREYHLFTNRHKHAVVILCTEDEVEKFAACTSRGDRQSA